MTSRTSVGSSDLQNHDAIHRWSNQSSGRHQQPCNLGSACRHVRHVRHHILERQRRNIRPQLMPICPGAQSNALSAEVATFQMPLSRAISQGLIRCCKLIRFRQNFGHFVCEGCPRRDKNPRQIGGFSTVSTSFGRLSPPRRMGDSNPRGLAPNQLSKLAP